MTDTIDVDSHAAPEPSGGQPDREANVEIVPGPQSRDVCGARNALVATGCVRSNVARPIGRQDAASDALRRVRCFGYEHLAQVARESKSCASGIGACSKAEPMEETSCLP